MSLIGTLDSGLSAMNAFQQGLEVIGNNIANVNTVGYKDQTAQYSDNFSDILQQSSPGTGNAATTSGVQIGTGVTFAGVSTSFAEGQITETGQSTNLAISGAGFFNVADPVSGQVYATRAGNFSLDNSGDLVTPTGQDVQGLTGGTTSYNATVVNGALVFTPTNTAPSGVGNIKMSLNLSVGNGITNSTGGAFTDAQVAAAAPTLSSFSVNSAGQVVGSMSNGDTFVSGQVLIQNYNDPSALQNAGNNLFTGLEAAGPTNGSLSLSGGSNTPGTNNLGTIQGGSLEQSNVDLTQEFANMITAQRSFQAGSRLLTMSDTILEDVINLKR
jgi:flagellar hook protein FlgE